MNDQLQLLIALQKVDTTILAAIREVELLPARLVNHEAVFKNAESECSRAEIVLADSAEKKRGKEREISEAKDRSVKLKARTSEIKKNTEYQANLAEVDRAEAGINSLEAALAQILAGAETARQTIAAQKTRIEQEQSALETVRQEIAAEATGKNEEIKRLKSERKKIVLQLEPEVNDHYMTLMRMHRGIAVTEAKNAICQGCNLHIPPQLYVEIKSGDAIETCPECRRILYHVRPEGNGLSAASAVSETRASD
ncbi:MAG TPA: C4-type zinc ribbon domain-containing protein [Dissulfurispiraceae bacterium]|nr:C4-type zinc ribbon domain-containing protein [Dissulfurispiraceae bacterium]